MKTHQNKDDVTTAKRLFVGLSIGLLLASLIVVFGPAQAGSTDNVTDECIGRVDQGNHVFKTEDHKSGCEFRCDEGDYVTVEVSSEGGRGRVTIVGECEGARAQCVNKARSCDETTGLYLAKQGGTGECRFKVNHYNPVDKIFRCRAISPQGEWQEPPVYSVCVVHSLDAWILGGSVGGGLVEICYYEGNDVCVDLIGTFEPEPTPWVIACGGDIVDTPLYQLCDLSHELADDTFCVAT